MPKSTFSNAYILFRQLLVDERIKKGVSQQALSQKLGKPQSFVAKYENGERRLDLIELIYILQALGTDPKDFISNLLHILEGNNELNR